jgi:ABC-type nitrate/sulfonate/bicarbonate transport system permease component
VSIVADSPQPKAPAASTPRPTSRRGAFKRPSGTRLQTRAAGVGLLVALGILWELSARLHWLDTPSWVPLTRVFPAWWDGIASFELPAEVLATLRRMAMGYLIATVVGVLVGLLMGRSKWVHGLLQPLVELVRPIPSPAYLPIAILMLGIGDTMKVFVIALASVFPILLNTYSGVRAIDPVEIDTGRTLGLRERKILMQIVLPSASPYIFSGLRVSVAISFIVAVLSEMVAGDDGMGYVVLATQRNFQIPEMYAGVFTLAIVGYGLNLLVVAVERFAFRWKVTDNSH